MAFVLGWTGAIAASGCGAPIGNAAMTPSALSGGCGTCSDDEEKGQPQQGCAVLACTSGCVAGPATVGDSPRGPGRVIASEKTTPALHEALRARAIPPDHPPPR